MPDALDDAWDALDEAWDSAPVPAQDWLRLSGAKQDIARDEVMGDDAGVSVDSDPSSALPREYNPEHGIDTAAAPSLGFASRIAPDPRMIAASGILGNPLGPVVGGNLEGFYRLTGARQGMEDAEQIDPQGYTAGGLAGDLFNLFAQPGTVLEHGPRYTGTGFGQVAAAVKPFARAAAASGLRLLSKGVRAVPAGLGAVVGGGLGDMGGAAAGAAVGESLGGSLGKRGADALDAAALRMKPPPAAPFDESATSVLQQPLADEVGSGGVPDSGLELDPVPDELLRLKDKMGMRERPGDRGVTGEVDAADMSSVLSSEQEQAIVAHSEAGNSDEAIARAMQISEEDVNAVLQGNRTRGAASAANAQSPGDVPPDAPPAAEPPPVPEPGPLTQFENRYDAFMTGPEPELGGHTSQGLDPMSPLRVAQRAVQLDNVRARPRVPIPGADSTQYPRMRAAVDAAPRTPQELAEIADNPGSGEDLLSLLDDTGSRTGPGFLRPDVPQPPGAPPFKEPPINFGAPVENDPSVTSPGLHILDPVTEGRRVPMSTADAMDMADIADTMKNSGEAPGASMGKYVRVGNRVTGGDAMAAMDRDVTGGAQTPSDPAAFAARIGLLPEVERGTELMRLYDRDPDLFAAVVAALPGSSKQGPLRMRPTMAGGEFPVDEGVGGPANARSWGDNFLADLIDGGAGLGAVQDYQRAALAGGGNAGGGGPYWMGQRAIRPGPRHLTPEQLIANTKGLNPAQLKAISLGHDEGSWARLGAEGVRDDMIQGLVRASRKEAPEWLVTTIDQNTGKRTRNYYPDEVLAKRAAAKAMEDSPDVEATARPANAGSMPQRDYDALLAQVRHRLHGGEGSNPGSAATRLRRLVEDQGDASTAHHIVSDLPDPESEYLIEHLYELGEVPPRDEPASNQQVRDTLHQWIDVLADMAVHGDAPMPPMPGADPVVPEHVAEWWFQFADDPIDGPAWAGAHNAMEHLPDAERDGLLGALTDQDLGNFARWIDTTTGERMDGWQYSREEALQRIRHSLDLGID